MKNFSAYTIASNCTDLTDVQYGIDELKEYFSKTDKPLKTARIRFSRLMDKIEKLQTLCLPKV